MKKILHISLVFSLFLINTYILAQPTIISVTATSTDCHGSQSGSITFAVTGGKKPYYYYIIKGGETQSSPQTNDTIYTFYNVSAGIYLCIVEDNNSLNDFRNRTVSEPDPIKITSVKQTPITCAGYDDGKLELTASGESGSYNFLLRPSDLSTGTGSFDMLMPGSYRVIVSDASGCQSKDSTNLIVFNDPLPITITSENASDLSCFNSNNGKISVSATGGTGTLEYILNPGGTSNNNGNFNDLTKGTYTVQVTDINGCPGAVSNSITINEPLPLVFSSQNKTDASCSGINDGVINVSASGGNTPYIFTLSPGGITNSHGNFIGLSPGTYTVSLTDSNSCGPVISNEFLISQPVAITIDNIISKNISCHNQNNGEINVIASGGNAPLRYTLNPGGITQATGNFGGLAAGFYTVTVSDTKGCTPASTSPIIIANPPPITIVNQTVNQISCNGEMNGSISVNAQGGTGALQYTLNPGNITNSNGNFNNLGPGIYTIIVRDANNCPQASTGPIQITEPAKISVSVNTSSSLNLACYGDNNGTININVSGGTAPYSFAWTGPNGFSASTQNISAASAGNYNLTVTDSKSCVVSYTPIATISQPEQLQITFSKADVTCHGDTDGSVTVNVSGGRPGYTYSTDGINYQTSNLISSLAANNYTIYVKDNNSCIVSNTVTINEPDELKISSETKTDGNLCFGNSMGEIRITGVSGGNPPYGYSIDGGLNFSASSLFTNLPAGTYQTVVKDSKGCIVNGNLNVINEPAAIHIDNFTRNNVSGCYGNNNGQINISASGGTGIIKYRINNGPLQTSGVFSALKADNYFIEIIDENNCIKDTTVVITQPSAIRIISFSKTNVSGCAGNTNGIINVSATGGTGSLQYRLNSNPYQGSGNFTGLSAGNYTLTIRDQNNCLKDTAFRISEPAPLTATITSSVYINEYYKGSINITNVTGGTGSYLYSITGMTGPFTTTTNYTGLNAGTYTVVVRDQNNCIYSKTIEITQMPPLNVIVTPANPLCNGSASGKIKITVTNASGDIAYSIDDSVSWHTNNEFNDLPAGTYKVAVREGSGRYFKSEVILKYPPPIMVSSNVTPAGCNAFSPDGSAIISVSGGTGVKTFKWSDGPTTKDRMNINSGNYLLSTTDANGCEITTPVFVPAQTYVFANAGVDTTVCAGSTITLNGKGGLTYSWSPAAGLSNPNIANPSVTISQNSIFILTTTGENNCYNMDTVIVNIYPNLGLFAGSDTAILINHSINLNATGGPFQTYRWTPSAGLNNPNIANPVASPRTTQAYIVHGVDEHGCIESDTIKITVIEEIVIYNSFSPNDDGINDYWDIDNAEYYPDIIVEVYNRWGEKMFSSKGYTSEKRWNGNYNGQKVPIGTYYYVVIPYSGAKPLTGPLTIIR